MKLAAIRDEIDGIDKELLTLLEKRMELVNQVTTYKKETRMPILDEGREKQVLKKIAARVENKDFQATLVNTFADIMKNSRDYQATQLDKLDSRK